MQRKWPRSPREPRKSGRNDVRMPRDQGSRRVDRALAGFRRTSDRSQQAPARSRHLAGKPPVSADELAAVVHEYHHVHEDHRRAPPRSRVRRHLESRLRNLRTRFERLLAEAPVSETDRQHWRERFQRGATASPPSEDVHPLLFRGHSESGSELRLGAAADGTIVASIDGTRVAVLDDAEELMSTTPGFVFVLDDQRFHETFGATDASLADLRDALRRGRRPRRRHLRLLVEDGLVDRTLGLTARGRRALGLDAVPTRHADARG